MKKIIGGFLILAGIGMFSDGYTAGSAICILIGVILIVKPKDSNAQTHVYQPGSAPQPTTDNSNEKVRMFKNGYTISSRDGGEKVSLLPSSYVVLDFETTGLNKSTDKIIEIGAVKVVNGEIVDQMSELINPGKNITKKITEITGITNADVRYAPMQEAVIPYFCRFIEGNMLLAYNADFDMGFLAKAAMDCGISADFQYIDVLGLARRFIPGMPNYKLATMIETFHLSDEKQTHRALDDAVATQMLYELIHSDHKYA